VTRFKKTWSVAKTAQVSLAMVKARAHVAGYRRACADVSDIHLACAKDRSGCCDAERDALAQSDAAVLPLAAVGV
jgi:hypothetical protein